MRTVGLFFSFSVLWMGLAQAEKKGPLPGSSKARGLKLEGIQIQGEVKNPSDFYFQRKDAERFDSLVKRKPHFHREMLRDVVFTK